LPIRAIERMRVRAIRRLLALSGSERVLEVGCGGGNLIERVGGRRFGIDLSPFILDKARARLGPAVPLVRGDAMSLPFASGAFDRVLCSEVLEHVLNPESVVRELRRVLRPGGHAVVSVPNEQVINWLKRVAFALPLSRRLIAGDAGGYQVPLRMDDEWHLHAFSRARLEAAVDGQFLMREVVWIPSRVLPLRLLARLEPI
jgi:SAM-dependent methyltransferase